MNVLCHKKTINKSGVWLLFFCLIPLSITLIFMIRFLDFFINWSFYSLFWIFALVLFPAFGFTYFLDEALWQIIGEEIIQYNEKYVVIERRGRIFRKKNIIFWNNIKDITPDNKYSIYRMVSYFSIAGTRQETVKIYCVNKRHVYCGINLNETQSKDLITQLQQLRAQYEKER